MGSKKTPSNLSDKINVNNNKMWLNASYGAIQFATENGSHHKDSVKVSDIYVLLQAEIEQRLFLALNWP